MVFKSKTPEEAQKEAEDRMAEERDRARQEDHDTEHELAQDSNKPK